MTTKKPLPTNMNWMKPYKPAPHPMKARLDAVNEVPSLVTPNRIKPSGK